uniref:Isochorismatase n=1 Tax=uncultured Helicobacter sp. TaxID=175537 RepID=A0A650EM27_9HELI|nr:isochorismatase [uncultured Helicobacter sp.]
MPNLSNIASIPLLSPKDCVLVCIDVQEKLLPAMQHHEKVIKYSNMLLHTASLLDMPLLVTEQYPKGLGHTHSAINLPQDACVIEKTTFSVFGEERFNQALAKLSELSESAPKTLIFFGIEAHICVLQSLLDARRLGIDSILVADASSSRFKPHYKLALRELAICGVRILSTESLLFMFLKDAKSPHFKAISALVK